MQAVGLPYPAFFNPAWAPCCCLCSILMLREWHTTSRIVLVPSVPYLTLLMMHQPHIISPACGGWRHPSNNPFHLLLDISGALSNVSDDASTTPLSALLLVKIGGLMKGTISLIHVLMCHRYANAGLLAIWSARNDALHCTPCIS